MRVLIIGGSGFLGGELVRVCAAAGHQVAATYLTHPGPSPAGPGAPEGHPAAEPIQRGERRPGGNPHGSEVTWLPLDVRSRDDVTALLGSHRPDVTINTAYRQNDWAITADGGAHVAVAVAGAGGRLVHVSSDAVFSGADVRYDETCPPDPISPYGAAKAAAETAVRAVLPGAAIVRTSLIVGHGRSGHEAMVRSLATGRGAGVLFTDDVRCPVHVDDLAEALLEIAIGEHPGVHHVAGADAVSRHELGVLIARRDGLDEARLPTGRRADLGVPGPLDVRLDCTATRRRLRTRLRGAREFLTRPG
ncbi:dTDP-4-dehydrorhamnose reductase [Nonomuraea solani]|uniref:dTDP-4-dehydrorhamnose reductase n=1 Tax=Nonomuraea solani TaxID=1144553 RepID=A0A1H6EY89_9ACTN|nr:sugar nucleotide-binding protein [Nonomuraea solani]SEH01936.1 dTDP-4-dehydrorhamnose reductase [Nonomuraea solani]